MPWDAKSFKKHWKDASPAQLKKAAAIATAILKGGGEEGTAIATGIARAKAHGKKPHEHLYAEKK